MFDFDAHIELTIGKGEDAETYNIDEPTISAFFGGSLALSAKLPENRQARFLPACLAAGLLRPGTYDFPANKRNVL